MNKFISTILALLLIIAQPVSAQSPLLLMGAGPTGEDATDTPVSTSCISVSGSSVTFTAQGVGAANANRTSVVSIDWSDSTAAGTAELTAMTIGGISMVRATRASGDNQNSNSEIWYVANPTGTTANIVATFSTAVDGIVIGVYSLVGYIASPTASAVGTTTVSQAYTNKQVAIVSASRTTNVSTALSNVTNDYSAACGTGLWGISASQRLSGSGTLNSTISPTSDNPKIALALWVPTSSGSCSQATTFLARTTSPDATHIAAYTNFICGLVSDNIWSKFDVLYVLAAQSSGNALLNLVSTSFNGTANGSPTFTVDRGFTGVDGSGTVIINTNFNPTVGTNQFTVNSCHISGWSVTNISTVRGMMGYNASSGAQSTDIFPRYSADGKAYGRINSASIAGVTVADSIGDYISNRPDNTTAISYKNGVTILTNGAAAAATFPNLNIYVLGTNNSGAANGGAYQVAFASIGSSLTATDALNFYNRKRAYASAVGMPVP